jgi:hypothetical protein
MTPADARKLIDFAARAGADSAWLRRVAGELIEQQLELAELRRCIDSRKRQTLRLAVELSQADRAMRRARAPDRMASLCARFRIRRSYAFQLLKLAKSTEIADSPNGRLPSAHRSTSEDRNVSKLKDVSLATGAGTPPPGSKYGSADRPAKMPPLGAVPRANDSLASGETAGNFTMDMGKVGINASPTGTQSGSEAAQAAFEGNSK